METAVFKATNRIECAPKAKHVRYLIASTWARDVDIGLLFKYLSDRLHDSNWVTVFKALIVIHTLARDGCAERVLNYLAGATHILNLAGFRSRSTLGAEQTKNIHAYAAYLEEKVAVFRELRIDFAGKTDVVARLRGGQEKDEWRLNEIRVLQRAIDAVLGCKFFLDEINNEVTLAAYRLIVFDLLKLFHVGNEGVMNLLEHYFEMNKADARKSLNVYKKFCTQTEKVVEFLDVARRLQTALGTAIPRIKHAPISLAVTLEDYLNSSDFEENREEYKARKARKALNRSGHDMSQSTTIKQSSSVERRESNVVPALKGAGTDIIDFFSSLDAVQPAQQVSSFSFAQGPPAGLDHASAGLHNPFGGTAPPSAPQVIRAGFGGFSGDFDGKQSFGNFGDTDMQSMMAGVPSFAASFSTHNPFTQQLGPAQFNAQQPGFGTQAPAGILAGDNGNQIYTAGQPRPFAGAGANAFPDAVMGPRGSLASICTNDLLGGSTPFTVTTPSLNPFSPARYSTITSATAPGMIPNAVQPRHTAQPFDSLSSLNPFAQKPPPAAPVPIASMASCSGFNGGGGGGGGPFGGQFGGTSAGATAFGAGPLVFNSQDSGRRSVLAGQGDGGGGVGGSFGAFDGPACSLVQQDRFGGTIDPFGMTASSGWANARQQQPNPFGATGTSPLQPPQQPFGQQLSQQPSWGA